MLGDHQKQLLQLDVNSSPAAGNSSGGRYEQFKASGAMIANTPQRPRRQTPFRGYHPEGTGAPLGARSNPQRKPSGGAGASGSPLSVPAPSRHPVCHRGGCRSRGTQPRAGPGGPPSCHRPPPAPLPRPLGALTGTRARSSPAPGRAMAAPRLSP